MLLQYFALVTKALTINSMTIGPAVALRYLKSIRIALDEATEEELPLLDLDAEVRSRQVDDPMQLACITTWTRYGRMIMPPKKADPCKDAQNQRPDADARPSRAEL